MSTEEILRTMPMDQVAERLGVDRATAEAATRAALPTLLAGLQANATDPSGARSLAGAISEHDPSLVEGGVDLADVDTADGEKIVANIFGDNTDQVVQRLSGEGTAAQLGGGAIGKLVPKLLPILAPIVLSFLAKRLGQGGGGAVGGSGGGLMDILSSALGGGSDAKPGASSAPTSGGPDLGSILGDLLGGGGKGGGGSAPAGGGLDIGSILGDLLGGGKR